MAGSTCLRGRGAVLGERKIKKELFNVGDIEVGAGGLGGRCY